MTGLVASVLSGSKRGVDLTPNNGLMNFARGHHLTGRKSDDEDEIDNTIGWGGHMSIVDAPLEYDYLCYGIGHIPDIRKARYGET